MRDEADELRRVRFYGTNDLSVGWFVPRVVELATQFDPEHLSSHSVDILELHQVQQFLEHRLLPNTLSEAERDQLLSRAPQMRAAVARFFAAVDGSNLVHIVAGVGHDYRVDLLELLGRNKAFERCDSATMLAALKSIRVHLGEMLGNEHFVRAYDREVRDELLASPSNAEHLVHKYLQKDVRDPLYLPRSFTPADARLLLEHYIDSETANLNHVRLIANAKSLPEAGIDAKLKLRAKRRSDELNDRIFDKGEAFKFGCDVRFADDQEAPSILEVDDSEGTTLRYTYSKHWLEETLDYPSILNNFQFLFEFADRHVLLTLPSYPARLGVMERVMGLTGSTEYKTGTAYQLANMTSLAQTHMYRQFLTLHDIDLEKVISWFFETYLVAEFGIDHASFTPSSAGTPYLQRLRHLFAEMESVASQFRLYVENGAIDRELLTIGSDQMPYRRIPSLLDGKYLYATDAPEIVGILNLLFSDQSTLNYIDEDLHAENAVMLLNDNQIAYARFDSYQRPAIDHLLELGILKNTGTRIWFSNAEQLLILRAVFDTQADSYYHLSDAGRVQADSMIAKGWLTRRSSLLTSAEADYFDYFLNRVTFTNGPNLRNRYQHGSQAGDASNDAHHDNYVVALRLVLALVIKMNDDLCLAANELVVVPGDVVDAGRGVSLKHDMRDQHPARRSPLTQPITT